MFYGISLNNLSYITNDDQKIFDQLSLSFKQQKIGIVGRNGIGKSTLLKLIAGELQPSEGSISIEGRLCCLSQENYPGSTVSELLGINHKLAALERIQQGSIDTADYEILGEDWLIESATKESLQRVGLKNIDLLQPLHTLSGGELTRLQLLQVMTSDAEFILLDEPTNNLDADARESLYDAIRLFQKGCIIISHDRYLLGLMDHIVELTTLGVKEYGGNYDFYQQEKHLEERAAAKVLKDEVKQLRTAAKTIQERKEKHQRNQSRGNKERKKQIQAKGQVDKIAMNSAKGRSEKTNRRITLQADRKLETLQGNLQQAELKLEKLKSASMSIHQTGQLHNKEILSIDDVTFSYDERELISHFNLHLHSNERIAITGNNGSGKSTLLKLMTGELQPDSGKITVHTDNLCYLDQKTMLLDVNLSVLENFKKFNPVFSDNECRAYLAKFLFRNTAADKLVSELSSGQRLRALLACVLASWKKDALLLFDEPTNYFDLETLLVFEKALQDYPGGFIMVSHDRAFLDAIGITKEIQL